MLNATTVLIIAVGAGLQSVDLSNPNGVTLTYGNNTTTMVQPTKQLNNGFVPYQQPTTTPRPSGLVQLPKPTRNMNRVVGYYRNDAETRLSGRLRISDIPVHYYTDLIYSHFIVNDEGFVRYTDPYADLVDYGIERFIGLKGLGNVQRVLFAVGNWALYGGNYRKTYTGFNDTGTRNTLSISEIWNKILDSTISRNRFAFSAVRVMNRHGFDGIDIEYPWTGLGVESADTMRGKFIEFLRFIRSSIGHSKLLTIGPMLSELMLNGQTIARELQEIVNYANPVVQSPRFGFRSVHVQPKRLVRNKINKYLNYGYNSSFINLGIPLLGKGFRLDPEDYAQAKLTHIFSDRPVISWLSSSTKYSKDGTIEYSRLLLEHDVSASAYVRDEGSWALIDDEYSLISYIEPEDVCDLMSIFMSNQLGGVTIDSLDFDAYRFPGRAIIETVYKC